MAATKPENSASNLQHSTVHQLFMWRHLFREATFLQVVYFKLGHVGGR